MRFEDYGEYLKRRWDELGGEAATQAVRQRTGVFKEDQMPWTTDQPRAEALAEEFKAVQCPIFVRIVGELHHQQGHGDVGLGRKPGGNNWQTANGPIASDIIVLKSLDGDGAFQWVDCFGSMGGPGAKPQWAVIEPNTDRTWLEPPVPNGAPEQPPATAGPSPVGSRIVIDVAPIFAELIAPLEAIVEEQRKRIEALEARPSGSGASAELPEEIAFLSAHGTYLTAEQDGKVTNREDRPEAWQVWRPVKP